MNLFRIAFPTSGAVSNKFDDGLRIIFSGIAEELTEGLPDNGFFFSQFGIDAPLYGIPVTADIRPADAHMTDAICEANDSRLPPRLTSTSRQTHLRLVEDIRSLLRTLDGDSPVAHHKIIAARVRSLRMSVSPAEIYDRLCLAHPQACVFLFSTTMTGTWIGASPELLLDVSPRGIHTVALAGTRPSGTPAGTPWDSKNIEEQKIVADFILSILREEGLDPEISDTFTHPAGKIEHICNYISASFPKVEMPPAFSDKQRQKLDILTDTLIRRLSPTPALSGFPQREAADYINAHEANPRGCYGGVVGFHTAEATKAYVNLRSARLDVSSHMAWLYAGGGITRDSIPEEEWDETCRKISTMTGCM